MTACRMCLPIAGPGMRASYTQHGTVLTPDATAASSATEPLKPFTVRWHQPADAAGQWEIYMPRGCVTAGATATPLNAEASDTSGHDADQDWYLIPFSAQPADGDKYDVIVHAKQRAIDAADLPQNGDPDVAPAALVWMQKRQDAANRSADEKRAYAGDSTSVTVATITWQSNGDGGVSPKVTQTAMARSIVISGTANQEFDLWWAFTIDGAQLSVPKMGLLRRTLSTGTDVATIDNPVDVQSATQGIYLRVANNGGATQLTVALDVNDTSAGTNFFIVQLYEVDAYHVSSDFRSALWRLPMYLGGGS